MKKFTKKSLKGLKNMEGFNDRLSKRVINDLLATGLSTEELKGYISNIIEQGCISGCVSSLIYYSDTVKFFNCYRKEILKLFKEFICDNNLYENSEGLYIKIYDTVIYKNQKKFTTEEKNSLTWFAYEEVVYRIAVEYSELQY